MKKEIITLILAFIIIAASVYFIFTEFSQPTKPTTNKPTNTETFDTAAHYKNLENWSKEKRAEEEIRKRDEEWENNKYKTEDQRWKEMYQKNEEYYRRKKDQQKYYDSVYGK